MLFLPCAELKSCRVSNAQWQPFRSIHSIHSIPFHSIPALHQLCWKEIGPQYACQRPPLSFPPTRQSLSCLPCSDNPSANFILFFTPASLSDRRSPECQVIYAPMHSPSNLAYSPFRFDLTPSLPASSRKLMLRHQEISIFSEHFPHPKVAVPSGLCFYFGTLQ